MATSRIKGQDIQQVSICKEPGGTTYVMVGIPPKTFRVSLMTIAQLFDSFSFAHVKTGNIDSLVKPLYIAPSPDLDLKQYQAKDIMRILNIDKNKLFYWIKTHNLLTPDIEEANGTGSRAIFSLGNLLELVIIKELKGLGFDLRTIKRIKDQLIESKERTN